MFDRLIETGSKGADTKGRSWYFIVSTIFVGVLFLSAVIFSIYATELDLGIGELDTSRLIAPVMIDDPMREPPTLNQADRSGSSLPATERTVRTSHIANINETQNAPSSISVTQSTESARPARGNYDIGRLDSDGAGSRGARGPVIGERIGDGTGSETPIAAAQSAVKKIPEPPLPPKPVIRNIGVVNSKAISLPKPPYPPPARALNISGEVQVQVTIDEQGNVISSKALSGNKLLTAAAVQAAKKAKFTPAELSKVKVKVTGIIIYRFQM